jgi:hypothetical protein
MKRVDVDRAVPHASTRIVAFIHILIQVGVASETAKACSADTAASLPPMSGCSEVEVVWSCPRKHAQRNAFLAAMHSC